MPQQATRRIVIIEAEDSLFCAIEMDALLLLLFCPGTSFHFGGADSRVVKSLGCGARGPRIESL